MTERGWKNLPPRAPRAPALVAKTLIFRAADEDLLRGLGGALVLQWDALPDQLQDLLIDQAAIVVDHTDQPVAIEAFETFIRTARTAPLQPPREKRASAAISGK